MFLRLKLYSVEETLVEFQENNSRKQLYVNWNKVLY